MGLSRTMTNFPSPGRSSETRAAVMNLAIRDVLKRDFPAEPRLPSSRADLLAVESALHLRHQFCEVRFLFRSDRFEGVTQVASYIRVPRHQVAAHLRAQVQQFADRHAGNLFGWQHRW